MEIGELTEQVRNDPLAMTIHSIVKVMNIDFPSQFSKVFVDNETLKLVKRRLYSRLRGIDVAFIVDAYENLVEKSPRFMPGPNELVAEVKVISKQHIDALANQEEARRVSALPPPTHECNPVKLLASAKVRVDDDGEAGRLARLANARIEPEQLLKAHAGKIDRRYADARHQCAYHGCNRAGSISGGSNYYCANHYHAST